MQVKDAREDTLQKGSYGIKDMTNECGKRPSELVHSTCNIRLEGKRKMKA